MHQVSYFANFEGIFRFCRISLEGLGVSITALKHKLCSPLHIYRFLSLLCWVLPYPLRWQESHSVSQSAALFPSNSICLCVHLPYRLSHNTVKESLDKYICTYSLLCVCLSPSPCAKAWKVSAHQNITAQLIKWESLFLEGRWH